MAVGQVACPARRPNGSLTMRVPNASTAIALTASAILLLSACSGSSHSSVAVKGAQPAPASMSPSASAAADPKGPTITLPADLRVVFQWNPTGDPVKDAVLKDTEQYIRGLNEASIKANPNDPGYRFYSEGSAAQYAYEQVEANIKGGWVPTGTDRFYEAQVAVASDGEAGITFCEDQSRNFSKVVKSGKILRTAPSDADYYFYNIGLVEDSVKGVWRTNKITVQGKAVRCKA